MQFWIADRKIRHISPAKSRNQKMFWHTNVAVIPGHCEKGIPAMGCLLFALGLAYDPEWPSSPRTFAGFVENDG